MSLCMSGKLPNVSNSDSYILSQVFFRESKCEKKNGGPPESVYSRMMRTRRDGRRTTT